MNNQAVVAIQTGQTLAQIGQGIRRWVFPTGGRPQAGGGSVQRQNQ